jgi:hypothetical protein
VEAMVTQKMAQQEYIILCLEDSSDWNNATTRRTVMQVCASIVLVCGACGRRTVQRSNLDSSIAKTVK